VSAIEGESGLGRGRTGAGEGLFIGGGVAVVHAFVCPTPSCSSCSSFLSISRRHPRSMCSLEVGGGDKNCASSPDGGKRQNMADGSCDGARAVLQRREETVLGVQGGLG
jgi:hypothetical protein